MSRRTKAGTPPLGTRPSRSQDLDFVLRIEHDPEAAPYVLPWSRDQHQSAIADPDVGHWILERGRRAVGFLILCGLNSPDRNLEFKRIVVAEKGKGVGRGAVRLVKEIAFEQLGAHRLWLDVMEHNQRAIELYLSEGFTEEGVLRECLRRGNRFVSLVVMSMLETEYRRSLPAPGE